MLKLCLDLESSPLLRASLDERFFRVWDYYCDGEFPRHRAEKAEFDGRIAEILRKTDPKLLRDLARGDRALTRGSTFRGPEPFDPDVGDVRIIASRQLELALFRARRTLGEDAYLPASPTDRVCQAIPGLFVKLSERDRLLTVTPDMVRERRGGHDRVFASATSPCFPTQRYAQRANWCKTCAPSPRTATRSKWPSIPTR